MIPRKPKILVDFDGVIHRYSKGWYDGTAYDEPMEGALEYLELLDSLGYDIVIFSTRNAEDITAWLVIWNFSIFRVTNIKEPAVALIDDRAIRFLNWSEAADELLARYPVSLPEGIAVTMPTNETPLTTPEPPKETALGKDSVSASEVAQTQEDALVAEELATDE